MDTMFDDGMSPEDFHKEEPTVEQVNHLRSIISQREVQLDKYVQLAKDWEAIAKRNQEQLSALQSKLKVYEEWEKKYADALNQLSVLEQKNAQLRGVLTHAKDMLLAALNNQGGISGKERFPEPIWQAIQDARAVAEQALSTTPSDAYVRKEELEKANHTILDRDEEIARIELLHLFSHQQARIEELEWCTKHLDILMCEDYYLKGIKQRLEQLNKDQSV